MQPGVGTILVLVLQVIFPHSKQSSFPQSFLLLNVAGRLGRNGGFVCEDILFIERCVLTPAYHQEKVFILGSSEERTF